MPHYFALKQFDQQQMIKIMFFEIWYAFSGRIQNGKDFQKK
jgi:hypothetical protein